MLYLRVITAIFLVAYVGGLLFLLPAKGFALGIAPLLLLGGVEWCRLAGVKQPFGQLLYLVLLAMVMAGCFYRPMMMQWLLPMALVWWLVVGWVLVGYPRRQPQWLLNKIGMLAVGPLLLVVPWFSLYLLRVQGQGEWLVLFLFLLIWGADIGAYFSGRQWGRRKLLPAVSPGKSWEGVVGGNLVAILVALAVAVATGKEDRDIGYYLLVGVLISLVSVVGDLAESLFKRRADVKDSGKLLPGHGGVLDRIDSLTIAAPLFGLLMVGHW